MGEWLLAVLNIVWIDIVLAGDNAVVIALAVRNLEARQRLIGIAAGAGAAVVLRGYCRMDCTTSSAGWMSAQLSSKRATCAGVRLSRMVTVSPRAIQASARWDPIKPAPPVMKTRMRLSLF